MDITLAEVKATLGKPSRGKVYCRANNQHESHEVKATLGKPSRDKVYCRANNQHESHGKSLNGYHFDRGKGNTWKAK
ncbi:hypothetical protein J6590_052942 [Homalodisca vitripennis]|nr:hypothetical protein J6590_052942 [Homalodisca vitripennis]